MQTNFSLAQLADPAIAEADKILRACVHCGFCTATCPTYVLLGDELDSPRGRIYLIKDMLENDRPATPEVVKHLDRCLSCLSCMTTCPSGVHYMHLVDHARVHVEATYRRPLPDRLMRALLAKVLPNPALLRPALSVAVLAKPLAPLFDWLGAGRLSAMLRLAAWPSWRPGGTRPHAAPPGERRGRVALFAGCVNSVLAPSINAAAIRILNRHGIEIVCPPGEACCGALVHHLGQEHRALEQARRNIDAWTQEIEGEGLDAILVTASGCGTVIKDYGYLLRTDSHYAAKAERISALTKDICEYLSGLPLTGTAPAELVVAYHAPCSLQHGQKVINAPKALLTRAGFAVKDIPEGHLCCGSAGTYNVLQSAIADQLLRRKISNIHKVGPDLIATGNVGCITQIASASDIPIVHTVELLDWTTGGPAPSALAGHATARGKRRAS